MRRYLIIFLSILFSVSLDAHVSVTAEIDSTAILIGQQAHISLKVTANANEQISFPVFPQNQLTQGIEVVSENIVNKTDLNEGRQKQVTKVYTITSFDSSFYYIPPFKVQVSGKNYLSKSLALKVETIPVDTLHLDKYFGPKDIADVPFSWRDWRGLFGYSLLLILLLCVLSYILLQLHNKRPLLKKFRIRPPLPPHQWAMKEIQKINQRQDVKEDTKEYYTKLTDILRSYIQRRYGFNAREMTSGEIIEHLTAQQDKAAIEELKQLFQVADLAKFAKLQTQLNENDENLLRAVEFIKATTNTETETQPKPKTVVPPEVQRSTRTRLILKLVIGIVAALCLALLFLIGKGLYYIFF